MTVYKPYKIYEEEEEFVIRVPKTDFKKSEINNHLSDYLKYLSISKKSKATKKDITVLVKEINNNISKGLKEKFQ